MLDSPNHEEGRLVDDSPLAHRRLPDRLERLRLGWGGVKAAKFEIFVYVAATTVVLVVARYL
jgi:hypothetical protein